MKASSPIPTAMETASTIAASSVEAASPAAVEAASPAAVETASPAAVETTTTTTPMTAAMLGEDRDRQTNE